MPNPDRPVYTTRKYRAEDLGADDVCRNSYGKWDVVTDVKPTESKLYVDVTFETGIVSQLRRVALVDVQAVRPS